MVSPECTVLRTLGKVMTYCNVGLTYRNRIEAKSGDSSLDLNLVKVPSFCG